MSLTRLDFVVWNVSYEMFLVGRKDTTYLRHYIYIYVNTECIASISGWFVQVSYK